jgi:transcriptional regulator with XRE-family HTH domain
MRPTRRKGHASEIEKVEMSPGKQQKAQQLPSTRLKKLNNLVETVCGIYTRVARRLGVHRSYVSRVARGERRSEPVEGALLQEYENFENH